MRYALLLGSLLALAAALGLCLFGGVSGAGAVALATPEVVMVTPTPYRCDNGDVLGSSSACPMAVLYVGATPTPDPYRSAALAADGRTYGLYKGWTYGDVMIASGVLLLCCLYGLQMLLRARRGG